jgi:hypothetical protein
MVLVFGRKRQNDRRQIATDGFEKNICMLDDDRTKLEAGIEPATYVLRPEAHEVGTTVTQIEYLSPGVLVHDHGTGWFSIR